MNKLLLKMATGKIARKFVLASLRGFSRRSETKVDDFIVQAITHLLDGDVDAAISLLEAFIVNWRNDSATA